MNPLVLVGGAGLIAGMMNALAGGGTFVTLPALIAAGVSSVNANTTSTGALFPGQLPSTWADRDGLGSIGPVPLRSLLIATSVCGAVRWGEGLVLPAAAILGAFCGSLIGRRGPAGGIRAVTVWLSVGITLAFFVRAYLT